MDRYRVEAEAVIEDGGLKMERLFAALGAYFTARSVGDDEGLALSGEVLKEHGMSLDCMVTLVDESVLPPPPPFEPPV